MAINVIAATLLSRFQCGNLLQRDAVVAAEFVQSIVQDQKARRLLLEEDPNKRTGPLTEFFTHIAFMPDVVRANVYFAANNHSVVR